jgi:hypothetical protein
MRRRDIADKREVTMQEILEPMSEATVSVKERVLKNNFARHFFAVKSKCFGD